MKNLMFILVAAIFLGAPELKSQELKIMAGIPISYNIDEAESHMRLLYGNVIRSGETLTSKNVDFRGKYSGVDIDIFFLGGKIRRGLIKFYKNTKIYEEYARVKNVIWESLSEDIRETYGVYSKKSDNLWMQWDFENANIDLVNKNAMMKDNNVVSEVKYSVKISPHHVDDLKKDYQSKFSSDPITGFMGIEFKSGLQEVKSKMEKEKFLESTDVGDGVILYKNVDFLGRKADIFFSFYEDKFYRGMAVFYPKNESEYISLYNEIKGYVSKKYGQGKSYESYKYPYEKNDGHTETAIQLGKASFSTYWGGYLSKIENVSNANSILLMINDEGKSILSYSHGEITKKEEKLNEDSYMDKL